MINDKCPECGNKLIHKIWGPGFHECQYCQNKKRQQNYYESRTDSDDTSVFSAIASISGSGLPISSGDDSQPSFSGSGGDFGGGGASSSWSDYSSPSSSSDSSSCSSDSSSSCDSGSSSSSD
jgi:hypothetical protein